MQPSRCLRDFIEKAQSGDREAFGELAARYTGRTESLIRRLLGAQLKRVVEVEDLTQETFLRALRSTDLTPDVIEDRFRRWIRAGAVASVSEKGEDA